MNTNQQLTSKEIFINQRKNNRFFFFCFRNERINEKKKKKMRKSWRDAVQNIQLDTKMKELKQKQQSFSTKEKTILKTAFKNFNSNLDELFGTLKNFFIPDSELRKIVANDTRSTILEPYSQFYDMYPISTFFFFEWSKS